MKKPDLDSYPDDINNEVNVSDNEINAGGLNANQDEDDHDIAVIEVEEQIVLPTDYNKLNKFNCYTVSSEENAPNVLFESLLPIPLLVLSMPLMQEHLVLLMRIRLCLSQLVK